MRHVSKGSGATFRLGRLTSFVLLLAALCALVAPTGAQAQGRERRLIVEVGKALKLEGVQNAESVFVADPTIADVSKSPGDAHFLYGRSPGETTVIAADLAGKTLFRYDLVVIHGVTELQAMLGQRFRAESITLNSARGSLHVSGAVSDELTRQNILTSLKGSVPDGVLIDELTVRSSQLIRLEVKMLEVARDKLEQYGADWIGLLSNAGQLNSATRSAASLNALLKLLTDNGVATIAAETTLITTHNKKAEFSVGEEIAIPTFAATTNAGGNNFSVDFKFVGVNIGFVPLLMPGGKVGLEVNAVVSNSQATASQINGNSFPNLSSRRVMTHLELESGRSSVIGGLSRVETGAGLQKPASGRPQITQTLFGLERIESSQKNLIIVVTPRFDDQSRPGIAELVRPVQSNLEFILSKKVGRRAATDGSSIRIHGPAGLLY